MGLLFAAALSAPSKSDLQQTSIIRIRDREKMRKIHKILAGSPWIAQAPEFLFFCGDHRRLQEVFSVRQAEFPNNHLDSFFNAAVDCGIVLSHFVQAVHAVGLGCCPISEVRDRCQEFSTLLELPKWVFPLCGLSLGYPVHLEALTPRLGLDCSVHEDRYDCARNSRGILEYDQRRAAIKPYKAPRNPDRFGTPAIYGWSEEKFRQYVEVQRQDFGEYIRSQGFSLD